MGELHGQRGLFPRSYVTQNLAMAKQATELGQSSVIGRMLYNYSGRLDEGKNLKKTSSAGGIMKTLRKIFN
jgi:hypothetical protein